MTTVHENDVLVDGFVVALEDFRWPYPPFAS